MHQYQRLLIVLFLLAFWACKEEKMEMDEPGRLFVGSEFTKTFGGAGDDIAQSILRKDNFIYIVGTANKFNNQGGQMYLLKLNLAGELLFEKTFGNGVEHQGMDLILSKDNHLLLVGSFKASNNSEKDVYVLKLDLNGNVVWEKTYGGPLEDFAVAVIETTSGEFCIAGATKSFGASVLDRYVIWLNQKGDLIKELRQGGLKLDGSSDIIELENQDLVLFGYTESYGANSRDFYLLRMNSQGDSLWSKRYGGDGYEESHSIARTEEGGFLINGHSSSTDPNHNMYAIKLTEGGDVIWEKEFGGDQHDGGESLLIDNRGLFVFLGRSMSFGNGSRNLYYTITKPDGDILEEIFIDEVGDDRGYAITEDDLHYYIVGQSNSFSGGDSDVLLVRRKKSF